MLGQAILGQGRAAEAERLVAGNQARLDERLKGGAFLLENYSVADIATFLVVHWGLRLGAATGGYTDCDWLPRRYHVPGVRNPNCASVRNNTDRSPFNLTWPRINYMAGRGVRTDTQRPPHWAQLQAICGH